MYIAECDFSKFKPYLRELNKTEPEVMRISTTPQDSKKWDKFNPKLTQICRVIEIFKQFVSVFVVKSRTINRITMLLRWRSGRRLENSDISSRLNLIRIVLWAENQQTELSVMIGGFYYANNSLYTRLDIIRVLMDPKCF